MASLSIYLLTFNCARNLIDPPALAASLFTSLPPSSPLPDVIALSLQEVAPIAESFLGGARLVPYLARAADALRLAAETREPERDEVYAPVATKAVGMTALMVFAREDLVSTVKWVQTAGVGVGLWGMGNKGAAGVRVGFGGGRDAVLTFVGAHLAPMERNTARRNHDWEDIVRGLVFDTRVAFGDGAAKGTDEAAPLLDHHDGDGGGDEGGAGKPTGLYEPATAIFFFGDLNYRTSDERPSPDAHAHFPHPAHTPDNPQHWTHLLSHDQLTRERRTRRALHGFSEAPITFPPSYKHLRPGEGVWHWAPHRWPSWCDRVLFLTPAGEEVGGYASLPVMASSDHQGVVLAVGVKGGKRVAVSAPWGVRRDWRERRAWARRREVLVGVLAYLVLTGEGRAVLAGVLGGAIVAWWAFSRVLA
ncbi:DNase I-like protein [Trichodelitschia bisporula]|uniref:DNase I-like protein n=1 Tax=Trichodelitschia bisporula TaxID=703511 RepID=A0A6G1HQY5_9PEZI|nr:DNase I-like protein [Trichodelitschia bisporula]